ncbi:PilS (plasmid) [Pseudomonas fluorescens R124]|uniref:PilS n=1 Tax=Pseudomonas fluorescens R124 TaxID=743713 RepID=K0WMY3_PSEFL|nr:type 4 pilus major pilin [Pseudomonas fluorescens]AFS51703.1 PilS [Pseudomonas fluorescens R124]EJZ60948.1 PilS [Pseudomonas fluorescens R124]
MKTETTAVITAENPAVPNLPYARKLGRRSPRQGGFGALEVMIAIAVGIFAIIGAIAWYSKLTNTSNNNEELQNVSSLITNTRQLKTQSGYGPTGTNLIPVLIAGEGIPENMQKSGSTVSNLWGGAVTNVSTGSGYNMTYAGVPDSNCIFLATKSANSNSLTIRINGGTAITGEVTSIAATSACTSGTNTLSWSGR